MAIRYASEIIKEIKSRGPIITSVTCANGEEFEKWLYDEDDIDAVFVVKERMISPDAQEKEYREFYGDAA